MSVAVMELWDVEHLAKVLGVSTDWIYRQVRAGKLPAFKVAGKLKFSELRIRQWLEAQKTISQPSPEAP